MQNEEKWLLDEKYNGMPCDAFYADRTRLLAGEPVAYIIGHIPFCNCTINLDSYPLIPRPETEYWTNRFIETQQKTGLSTPLHILDLCAGSGCIGIAVAHALDQATLDLAEIEADHIATIEKNCAANNLPSSRYHTYTSDLFANLPEHQLYDHIVTNPPYIDPAVDRTEKSVRTFEPSKALYGGTFGMEYLARILHTAPAYLHPGGSLWLEHEPEHLRAIATLARPHFAEIHTYNDQYNCARFSVCTMAQ